MKFLFTTEARRTRRYTEKIVVSKRKIQEISYEIIGAAIEVHRLMGPGLIESVYETCMVDEMTSRGLDVERQKMVPLLYKGKNLGSFLKLDLLVNDLVIVELKAVETVIPIHRAQLLSYLKLTGKPKGLLINFNCEQIKDDLLSFVTPEYAQLPR